MSTLCGIGILNSEVTVSFLPGGHQIGASLIGEEFQNNIILVVGQTGGQSIDKSVAGQIGGFGSDGRQSGDDLIIDHITCRSSAGVLEAIGDISGRTTILAGVSDLLTQGLLQGGDASQVLGEQGDVIDPTFTAIGSIVAIDAGHRNGHQEGIGGGNNLLGDSSFNDQIQAQSQVSCLSLAVGIGRSHLDAAVSSHVLFQSILHGGGVCFQTGSQSVDQNIGLIEILGGIQLISIGIVLSTIFQTQSLQEVSTLHLVDAIQDFHMVIGTGVSSGFRELDDVSDLHIAELNALDCVAVACFAIAQIRLVVSIACAFTAQNINNTSLIHHAGGNIGGIPNAVLFSVGEIVLIDGQRTLAVLVNGGICHLSCKCSRHTAQAQDQSQTHSNNLLKTLHVAFSFLI